jgi:hypothetical protein
MNLYVARRCFFEVLGGEFMISTNASVEKDAPHVMNTLSYSFPEMHVGMTVVDRSLSHILLLNTILGRAIAQAVRRRLPTAAARVQTHVWSCGIL